MEMKFMIEPRLEPKVNWFVGSDNCGATADRSIE